MNVRSLAGQAVNGVAAEQAAILRRCAGYTVDEAGGQTPVYEDMPVLVRVQPLPDIPPRPQAGAWQARVARRFSLNARCGALNRPAGTGGDLLIWNDRVWLVDQVLEDWTPDGGWALVRGVLQMDLAEAPEPEGGAGAVRLCLPRVVPRKERP